MAVCFLADGQAPICQRPSGLDHARQSRASAVTVRFGGRYDAKGFELRKEPTMSVCFEMFASATQSWEVLFRDAARFATKLGRERLICISHSHESTVGVVTVCIGATG